MADSYEIKAKAGIRKFLNDYTSVEKKDQYEYCRRFLENVKNIPSPTSKGWAEISKEINMFFGDFVIYTKNNGDHLYAD